MTAYQNYWNLTIEQLLNEIDASEAMRCNLIDAIQNSRRTGIYPNQVINALRVGLSIKEGHRNIAFVAPMQSGKSGTAYVLCNYILPEIGFLKGRESVLFVTSMRDTDLYEQNRMNLEADFYDCFERQMRTSFIEVIKMNDFFKYPNPHKVVNDYDVKLIIRDEDQYGAGEESSFQNVFFATLRSKMPEIKLLAISATPYDILDAHFNEDCNVEVIEGERPPKYYGITEMLSEGLIEHYPENFSPLQKQEVNGEDIYSVHPKVIEYMQHLRGFEDGLGIIRVSNTVKAIELRNQLESQYHGKITCIAIGSDSSCDFKIQHGLEEVKKMILRQGKRVVLIVVQALTAGKDLNLLKEKVRFGIETRNRQLANGAQGITGRLCGYHNNREFKLMASVHLLNHYAAFEQDWEVFANPDWRNSLYNENVRGLSTHTKFNQEQAATDFIPILDIKTISHEQLLNEGNPLLEFIDNEAFHRLLSFFDRDFYNRNTKGTRFKTDGVTVRIASSYNPDSNRVYKNWNASLEDDFGNIFFKKNQYEYGILISNFPENDERNKLGFCGIKLFRSGQPEWRDQVTGIENQSMYTN